MTQNTSLAGLALTQEQAFTYKADDRAFVKAGKFTVGTAITTASFAFAIVETALSAIATAILSPSNLTRFNGAYKAAATRTRDSAHTVAQAARRTFGIEKKVAEAPKALDKTRVQKFKDFIQTSASKVSENAHRALNFGKEHKRPFIAASLTAALATAYFFAPEGIASDVADSVGNLPCTVFNAGMDLKDRVEAIVVSSDNETVATIQEGEVIPSDYEGGEVSVPTDSSLLTKSHVVWGALTLSSLGSAYSCIKG